MKAKLLLPLIAILLTSHASAAEKRTFRDQETSRAFSAEVISIEGETGDKVRLKLDSGKMVTVPISRLHKDDQAFLKTWAEDASEATVDADSTEVSQEASPEIRKSIRLGIIEEKGKIIALFDSEGMEGPYTKTIDIIANTDPIVVEAKFIVEVIVKAQE